MMSAIGTMIDSNDERQIDDILESLVDFAGTFYRFSLPKAIIRRRVNIAEPTHHE
jgi:hypothetical protein